MTKKSTGFTLIELLIAMTILSILSTAAFIIYFQVLPRARDSRRISDLNKLATALEVYYQKNGQYMDGTPDQPGSCTLGSGDTGAFYQILQDPLNSLNPHVFDLDNPVPRDPQKDPLTHDYPYYCYISVDDGKSYRLFAKLERCQDSGGNLSCSLNYNYTVYSNDLTISPAP